MFKRLLSGFILTLLLFLSIRATPAQALDFALIPLPELAKEADTIIIATPVDRDPAADSYDTYEVEIERVLKGNDIEKGDALDVNVLQWADEGILERGERYLLLLDFRVDRYYIAGVHQGFIRIGDDGTIASRFYKKNDVLSLLSSFDASDILQSGELSRDPNAAAGSGGSAAVEKPQSAGDGHGTGRPLRFTLIAAGGLAIGLIVLGTLAFVMSRRPD